MEEHQRSSIGEVKFMHFTKLHKRVQNKYEEMQKRLEKARSMDSLLSDEILVSSNERPRNYMEEIEDDRRIHTLFAETTIEKSISRESVVEDIEAEDVFSEEIDVYFIDDATEVVDSHVVPNVTITEICDSPVEYSPKLRKTVFVDNISISTNESRDSCENLNKLGELHKEIEEWSLPATPPPRISIRDRIGSKISAAKDKRRRKEQERQSALKDKEKEKVEGHIFSKTIKQDIVNVKPTKKNKIATVTVALIEANGLQYEKTENSSRMMNCRMKLGTEKAKSKIIKSNSKKIQWLELFNLNLYDDDDLLELSLWDKEVFLGKCNIDLSTIKMDKTHKTKVKLIEMPDVELFVLLTITGTALINTVYDADDYNSIEKEIIDMKEEFTWHRLKCEDGTVGYLKLIVYGAMGLVGSNCHCVLELENDRLQTQTEYRTNSPNWMKVFAFKFKDVTSILEITIFDDKRSEDLGKLSIALLDIENGKKKWYALKDNTQKERAKGSNPRIFLEMTVFWNVIKASLNVITPKEEKYLQTEEKLDRRLFSRHLSRAKAVVFWVLDTFVVIKDCFEWESTRLNLIALVIWLISCWCFKVWMIPLMFLIPFACYRPTKFYLINWKKYLLMFKIIEKPNAEDNEQKVNQEKEKEEKTTLRQKLNSIQEMVLSVQSFIGKLACFGESIKNLFNFNVPYLSCLAIFFISLVALVMFLIPVQYIFMIWGVHKFTRKILQPNRTPNNEVLDFLSRVPNDEVLLHCRELPLEDDDIVT